jgi:hypothetical protein
MATTVGPISGNKILVSSAGTTITCSTDATFSGTTERLETTCKDNDGAKTYEPGSQDGSIALSGIAKLDTITNFPLVVAAWKAKTESTWKYGGLDNVDDTYLQFDGFISDLTWEGPLNAPSTWSITIVPTSEILIFNT